MKNEKARITVCAFAAFAVALVAGARESDFEAKARELVSQLTPEEKAAQLVRDTPAVPRLGIPAYNWWNEALHGVARSGLATVFPQSIGRAAAFDVELEREIGHVIGVETRAKYNLYRKKGMRGRYVGLTLWSPNVNMFRDPRWGRGQETFGEDPYLSGKIGAAFVRGVQGDHPVYHLASACMKHFAVHSGPEAGRRRFNAVVSDRDLYEYYLPAFKTLWKEGRVSSAMTAYNAVNGVPATASKRLLKDILRGEWGFDGVIVSDVGAVDGIKAGHRYAPTLSEGVALAHEAGLDIGGDLNLKDAREAVLSGRLPMAVVDEHLTRLFAERMRLGNIGEDPTPWKGLGAESVANAKHRALALRAAEESLVLLVNKNNTLPLDTSRAERIGVSGPRAFDEVALNANYNGFSDCPSTVMSGIVGEGGADLLVEQHEFSSEDARCETIVACIGLNAKDEGEEGTYGGNGAGDRTKLALPESQLKELGYFRKNCKRLVAVVFGGSPLDLAPVTNICDAVLMAWYPGEAGGRAIARALFGKVNPSGRLPITFPKSVSDLPDLTSYAVEGRTYRYARAEPLFPFGYGLSYTSFEYSPVKVVERDGAVEASVTVKNVGKADGTEIVQLYVRSPEGSGDRRLHHLEGFRRVPLKAGESRSVTFRLSREQFGVYGEDGRLTYPHGEYVIFVGGSQPGAAQRQSSVLIML